MRGKARRLQLEYGLDFIIVDYMQLISNNKGSRETNRAQEVSEISRQIKAMARDLKVPVIAISQLSRAIEHRQSHRPLLSDLRESGSIEQDADVVMFVYREEYYLERKEPKLGSIEHAEWQSKMNEILGSADIMIGKQRHGPTGNVKVEFEAIYTKFKDAPKN